jgi:ubiquitin conjugation factor E4 B
MNRSNIISKMDTDECEAVKVEDRMDIEDNESKQEDEILKTISRILDVTWNEQCDGLHIVKGTMSAILDGSLSPENYPELISEIINEMVRQYLTFSLTKEIDVTSASDQILSSRMRNDDIEMDLEEVGISESSTKQSKTCTAKEAALFYLIESFNRSMDNRQQQEVSAECRQQLIRNAISLLDHDWIFEAGISKSDTRSRSPLLQVMYDETISYQEFVRHLMTEVYNNHPKRFTKIFNVLLEDIYLDMRCKQIKSVYTLPTHSIDRLIELISMSLLNNDTVQPICNLVVSHPTFMPPMCTDIPGREISHVSYLSPFLSISILVYDRFYDDDATIDSVIQLDLQNKLDYVRSLLHKLFYTFILNKDTRDTVLKYIGELLKHNAKRTQYNADERSLAQDGFMLNLMAVMQQLSIKVKLDRIDPLYPFHPQSLVNIEEDTKLRFETSEFTAHMEKLKAETQWEDPKFVSHCFFFTLHSHHLGIIPSISRYHKRLRAIKELQRMVDELNATRSRWENTPVARRNKQARDKWANRIKKLTKAKNTMKIIILDPGLNRNCLMFYSTVCEYILHQIEGRSSRLHR